MGTLIQDLRYGLRMLAKSPGFTAVAVLTLALGIGANTVIYSAVYAVLLKPLPFKDPGQLVFVEKKNPPRGWVRNPVSPAEILAWRNESSAFEDLAAWRRKPTRSSGARAAISQQVDVGDLRGRVFAWLFRASSIPPRVQAMVRHDTRDLPAEASRRAMTITSARARPGRRRHQIAIGSRQDRESCVVIDPGAAGRIDFQLTRSAKLL
jgi:hypothetical protein